MTPKEFNLTGYNLEEIEKENGEIASVRKRQKEWHSEIIAILNPEAKISFIPKTTSSLNTFSPLKYFLKNYISNNYYSNIYINRTIENLSNELENIPKRLVVKEANYGGI